jgi:hypothetical protein
MDPSWSLSRQRRLAYETEFFRKSPCSNGTTETPVCIKAHSMHEFGHVLGFLHEQDRADAPPLCPDGTRRRTDTPAASGSKLGPYDPSSIMNYCLSTYFTDPKLSEGDIAAVQKVYGVRGVAKEVPGCAFPCLFYGAAEGQCRSFPDGTSWLCRNGCDERVVSCQATTCLYACSDHGYAEGECRVVGTVGWQCDRGCLGTVSGCAN